MLIKVDVKAFEHGAKTYALYKSKIVIAEIKKREINEFDYVNYGLKIPDRKTLVWVNEDQITDNIDILIKRLKQEVKPIKQ